MTDQKLQIAPGKMDLFTAFWFLRDTIRQHVQHPYHPALEALEVLGRELMRWDAERLQRFSKTYDAALTGILVSTEVVDVTKMHNLAMQFAENRHGPEQAHIQAGDQMLAGDP